MRDCNTTAEPAFKGRDAIGAAVSGVPRTGGRIEFR